MKNQEIAAVYSAGLIQGITLVAFPAASTIFTNPHAFNFSSTAYGSLFIPQTILSIVSSLLSTQLNKKYGSKLVFMLGLLANFCAMSLLVISAFTMHHAALSYTLLLMATGCLGIGFGFTVPTINMVAALLYPQQVDSIILILNALLGIGTALAPAFIALFIGFGFWWGLPVMMLFLLSALFFFSLPLTLPGGKIKLSSHSSHRVSIPSRFWIFAAAALLYGFIETLNGNWISIYMDKVENATIQMQSLTLTAFWGMVTVGRIFFASAEKKIPEERTFRVLPFVAAAAFVLIAFLPSNIPYSGVIAFGLAGLGCSALLPLIISMGTKQLSTFTASVAGGVISFYQLGYGIAAFGVGPLQDNGILTLRQIYFFGAFIALLVGWLTRTIVKTASHDKQRDTGENI